jgi:hypothetical protein
MTSARSVHPHVDALVARLRVEGIPSRSSFLAAQVAGAKDSDLCALLEAWAERAVPRGFRHGPLLLPEGQPRELDRVPLGWKHEDYGCADMIVCDTFTALVLGTVTWERESRLVYLHPEREHEGIFLMPWWDERGPREGTKQVAPSLEALLART